VVEAIAGGSDVVGLSAKLTDSIGRSNALHKTYAPVEIEAVRKADVARLQAGARREPRTEGGRKLKLSTRPELKLCGGSVLTLICSCLHSSLERLGH
jgi:hypothetical protein